MENYEKANIALRALVIYRRIELVTAALLAIGTVIQFLANGPKFGILFLDLALIWAIRTALCGVFSRMRFVEGSSFRAAITHYCSEDPPKPSSPSE